MEGAFPVSAECGGYPCDADGRKDETVGNFRENSKTETYPGKRTPERTSRFPLQGEEAKEEEEESRHLSEDGFTGIDEGGEADEESARPSCCVPSGDMICEDVHTERRCAKKIEHREARNSDGESEELDGERNGEEQCWAHSEDVGVGPRAIEDGKGVAFSIRNGTGDNHEEAVVSPRCRECSQFSCEKKQRHPYEGHFWEPWNDAQAHSSILHAPVMLDAEDRPGKILGVAGLAEEHVLPVGESFSHGDGIGRDHRYAARDGIEHLMGDDALRLARRAENAKAEVGRADETGEFTKGNRRKESGVL